MNLFSFRHIIRGIYSVAACLTVIALSACNLVREPDQTYEDNDDISISFRIYTAKTSLTRAEDFFGSADENYIDLKNFKIMIFDEDQKLKQMLYDNGTLAENTTFTQLGPGFYHITTKLNKDLYSLASKFAIVALANWKSEDSQLITDFNGHSLDQQEIGSLTIDDLKEMTFTLNPSVTANEIQPASWMPGDNNSWIPMFGSSFNSLASYDREIYNVGHPMPVADVNLVRALTKIEIINKDITGGPAIKYIHLTHRNQKGYLVQDFDYQKSTGNVVTPTIPEANGYTQNAVPFRFEPETNTYAVYVPEMLLEEGVRRAIRVNITMNEEEISKWIYLAPYVDGQPIIQTNYDLDWQNIKRNYYYQYVINSLSFEFLVDVNPWVYGGKVHIDGDIEEIPD